ncbi:hypothetical protein IJJ97_02240 [bacterium]|nr:hypothetical protein [bacterium]
MQQLENSPATASSRQITDKSIIPFLKENRDKNRLAKIKSIFDDSTELRKELINFVKSIIDKIDKDKLIRNINTLKENILNSEFFKTYSYICHVLQTFSKSHELQNFIIQLQKLPDTPIFQFANKINNLYERLQLPWEKQEAYNLKLFNALQAHDPAKTKDVIKDVIDEIQKDHGLILSQNIINRHYIKKQIFEQFKEKEKNYKTDEEFINFLVTQRIIKNTANAIRKNKLYANITDIEATSQAFYFYKQTLSTPKKEDITQNQYLNEYNKKHQNYCWWISNPINDFIFYCNGKNAISSFNNDSKLYEIEINHMKHSLFITNEKYFQIEPIYAQMWILILQDINCLIQNYFDEIKNAIEKGNRIDRKYRKIIFNTNMFVALKMPVDSKREFSKYKYDLINSLKIIKNFVSFIKSISITGDYKIWKQWQPVENLKFFESIEINANGDIEIIITEEYLKINYYTFQSQISIPVTSFQNANLSILSWIFNIYVICFIHNRINHNSKYDRKFTMSKIINYLGFDLENLQYNRNLDKMPAQCYKILNGLSELGINFNFSSKSLSALENYKFSSKKIKDTLKEFEDKICHYSFTDEIEEHLKKHAPKTPEQHKKEFIEAKKKK